jgi:flagellar basal body P-ring protein FlgI
MVKMKLATIASAFALCGLVCSVIAFAGCNKEIIKLTKDDDKHIPKTVGSVATPFGLEPLSVMGYGVIGALPGTGGNVPTGSARSAAMRLLTRQMDDVPGFLASKEAAVVLVRALVPAGCKPGDQFDVEVQCLDEDRQTTSLRGGYLLACSLTDVADVSQLSQYGKDKGPNYRAGQEWASAHGPILTGIGAETDPRKGRILSGGKAKKERQLALLIKGEQAKTAETAAQIGRVVDDRFRVQSSGNFVRIADAKRPDYVSLRVPDAYKHNLQRYLDVLERIPLEPDSAVRVAWQRRCAAELYDPHKCFEVALRLEALGAETEEILHKACQHANPNVRFVAAEALAYMDRPTSADTLAQIALTFPQMRPYALGALAVVDDSACISRLRELMASPSVETRCGAFVALRTGHPQDVKTAAGKDCGFAVFQVAPQSQSLIHVATTGKPEIVLFGSSQELIPPFSLAVGPELVLTARDGQKECTLTRTEPGGKTEKQQSPLQLNEVINRSAQMGASYADVVDMLRQAFNGKNLSGQFVVDGLPRVIPWADLSRIDDPLQ